MSVTILFKFYIYMALFLQLNTILQKDTISVKLDSRQKAILVTSSRGLYVATVERLFYTASKILFIRKKGETINKYLRPVLTKIYLVYIRNINSWDLGNISQLSII